MKAKDINTDASGATIWGDDGRWLVDASTILNDGCISIAMSKFEVVEESQGSRQNLLLKLKPE